MKNWSQIKETEWHQIKRKDTTRNNSLLLPESTGVKAYTLKYNPLNLGWKRETQWGHFRGSINWCEISWMDGYPRFLRPYVNTM